MLLNLSQQPILQPQEMPQMIDRAVLKALQDATMDVLRCMCDTSVRLQGIQAQHWAGDFKSLLEINAQDDEQALSLSLPLELANRLINRMLGATHPILSAEKRQDGVQELINMIAGAFSHSVSSLPQLLTLPGALPEMPKAAHAVILFFEAEGKPFSIQLRV
jgi:CheY-specific phosphatase CheX